MFDAESDRSPIQFVRAVGISVEEDEPAAQKFPCHTLSCSVVGEDVTKTSDWEEMLQDIPHKSNVLNGFFIFQEGPTPGFRKSNVVT